mmetsp:Transcript_38504/g.108897  ORF Transcript_38504/g.108897 Transcript_38504/m.108897 type:complete len:208 (-) Transcript_38504:328-951(-)
MQRETCSSCSSKGDCAPLSTVRTTTTTVLKASSRFLHVGTFWSKASGWNASFAHFDLSFFPVACTKAGPMLHRHRWGLPPYVGDVDHIWTDGSFVSCSSLLSCPCSANCWGNDRAIWLSQADFVSREAWGPMTTNVKRYWTSASTSGRLERKPLLERLLCISLFFFRCRYASRLIGAVGSSAISVFVGTRPPSRSSGAASPASRAAL